MLKRVQHDGVGTLRIKQVAALPYRVLADGRVEVLLITSRETKRWVIPKGNPMPGLSGYAAAEREAFEEAGVVGAVCPVALGRYRYVKRRSDGSGREARVRVYPLAVQQELPDWPERHERDTGWFAPANAAKLVDEPDLADLIARMTSPPPPVMPALAWALGIRDRLRGGLAGMRWFRALLPAEGRFFALFEAHAETLVAGADALARLLQGGDGMAAAAREIVDREHQADDIARDVLHDVRRTFVTPFDRSAITSLISAMDDAIDEMNGCAKLIDLYGITAFEPPMRDMAALAVEAARITAEAVPLLRDIGPNAQRLHALTERVVKLEGKADDIHAAALKTLFQAHGAAEPMRFFIGRELYAALEKIADRFEDVANEIEGLVIDHA